jgi:hypothetical protein
VEFSTNLLEFAAVLDSGVLGYIAGRAQIRYELRAATTNEIRRLTIEVQRAFHDWIMRPAYTGGPGDYDRGPEIGAKIDALSIYYRVHDDWLDCKARESVEHILQGLGGHYTSHMEAFWSNDSLKKQRETARAAEEWLSTELPRLMEGVRVSPWWQRYRR